MNGNATENLATPPVINPLLPMVDINSNAAPFPPIISTSPNPAPPNDNAHPVTRVVMDDNAHTGKEYMVTWGDTGRCVCDSAILDE